MVVALRDTDTPLHVKKPDKTVVALGDSIFTGTDQVGIYTLFADDGRELERFTVNLLDAAASTLSHSTETEKEETPVSLETGLQPIAQEMWRWPALLAFAVLFVEWWFYHRDRL